MKILASRLFARKMFTTRKTKNSKYTYKLGCVNAIIALGRYKHTHFPNTPTCLTDQVKFAREVTFVALFQKLCPFESCVRITQS